MGNRDPIDYKKLAATDPGILTRWYKIPKTFPGLENKVKVVSWRVTGPIDYKKLGTTLESLLAGIRSQRLFPGNRSEQTTSNYVRTTLESLLANMV